MPSARPVFFVSDGTGITAETLGNTLLTQFDGLDFDKTILPFVNTMERAKSTVDYINFVGDQTGHRPLVFSTTVNESLASSGTIVAPSVRRGPTGGARRARACGRRWPHDGTLARRRGAPATRRGLSYPRNASDSGIVTTAHRHNGIMLSGYYHPILVAVSILVAIFAAYTGLSLADRVRSAHGIAATGWTAGGALALMLMQKPSAANPAAGDADRPIVAIHRPLVWHPYHALAFGDAARHVHALEAFADQEQRVADDGAGQRDLQHDQQRRDLVAHQGGEDGTDVHVGILGYWLLSWMAGVTCMARHAGSKPASRLAVPSRATGSVVAPPRSSALKAMSGMPT